MAQKRPSVCPIQNGDGREFTLWIGSRDAAFRMQSAIKAPTSHELRFALMNQGRTLVDQLLPEGASTLACREFPIDSSNFLAMPLTNTYNGGPQQGPKAKVFAPAP